MSFKSNLGIAALEEFKDVPVANLTPANEGLKGAVLGALPGFFGLGSVVGAATKNQVEKKKKEIEQLAQEIEKVAVDNGKKAVKEGKLSSDDFKKHISVGMKGIISGFIYGGLFGPIYGAIKGSELEDLMEEMEAKCKELNRILLQAQKDGGKPANESNEGEDDTEAAAAAAADVAKDDDAAAAAAASATPTATEEGTTGEAGQDAVDPNATTPADTVVDGEGAPEAGATDPALDPGTDAAAVTDTAGADVAPTDEGADPTANAEADTAAAADAAGAQVDDTAALPETTDETTDEADIEEVETEMESVDQIDDDLENVDDDVEKLTDASDALEGLVSILEAAAQRGGLDTFGAAAVRNNLNTVAKNLKTRPIMIPALEDMENASAKIDGANSAKDQIINFIKRIINTLKEAFNKVSAWITELYNRLTNAYVAIERRSEKLAEMVKSSTMKEGKLDSKGLSAKLSVNGKTTEDVAGLVTRLGQLAVRLNDPKSYKGYLEALDLCEQLIKDPSKDEELRGKISAVLDHWATEMEKLNDNSVKFHHTKVVSTKAFFFALLNNQFLTCSIPASAEAIRGMDSSVMDDKNLSSDGAVQALSQAEALKVCQAVAQIAKQARESAESNRGGVKELTAEINKRKDTITAMANAAGDSLMSEAGVQSEKIRKAMIFINTLLMTSPKLPIHAVNKALPRNLISALDYVAASVDGKADAQPVKALPGAAA